MRKTSAAAKRWWRSKRAMRTPPRSNVFLRAAVPIVRGDTTGAAGTIGAPARVMMYDDQGQRVEQAMEVGGSRHTHGIYDYPTGATRQAGKSWTSGEVIGEGQGRGPHTDTGKYDADQWIGEGQGPGKTPGDTWTSGQVVGEGQGKASTPTPASTTRNSGLARARAIGPALLMSRRSGKSSQR